MRVMRECKAADLLESGASVETVASILNPQNCIITERDKKIMNVASDSRCTQAEQDNARRILLKKRKL